MNSFASTVKNMGYVESDSFQSISTVISSVPHPTMRIFSNQSNKIGVIVSDFVPPTETERPLGRSILSWARNKSVALIVTNAVSSEGTLQSDLGAVSSTQNVRRRIEHSGIDLIDNPSLLGLPAILINEGSWTNTDVLH
ncbi:MAG: hypothetical protein ACYC7D_08155 [Nitrososphaerales archaeon]